MYGAVDGYHSTRTPAICFVTIFLLHIFSFRFTNSSVYYGLTIASGDMGSNKFVSVILNAFVEVPSNLIVVFLMNIPR